VCGSEASQQPMERLHSGLQLVHRSEAHQSRQRQLAAFEQRVMEKGEAGGKQCLCAHQKERVHHVHNAHSALGGRYVTVVERHGAANAPQGH
jgi:hypothetical protein